MSLYIIIIILFSSLSIILTEVYLRTIEYANSNNNKTEQDKIKLFAYPLFLILILALSVMPDYLPNNEYKVGVLTFLPFFNVGAYLIANWKRSVSTLHSK